MGMEKLFMAREAVCDLCYEGEPLIDRLVPMYRNR